VGLFSGATQRRGSNLPDVLGEATRARLGGGAPVPVGWSGSLAIPAVWAATRLRADLISTLPVQTYQRRPDGSAERVENPPVLEAPSADGGDIVNWLSAGSLALDLRGNNFGIIVDWDARGLPAQIELQHPDTCQVRKRSDGSLYYAIAGKPFERSQVWHERVNDVPGSPVGLSPIASMARSLGIAIAAEQFGADFFRDGAHPTALLMNEKTDTIPQEAAAIVKQRFLAALNGTREPVVLGGSWKYEQLSIAPNESQFLETLRFGVDQVARIFAVEPEQVGGGGGSGSTITYANREQRAIDWLAYKFGPYVIRRERALSRLTGPGRFVKLNVGGLLRTDLLTRYRSYAIGLRNGVLALDEPRELEDRLPLTAEQLQQLKDAGLLAAPTETIPAPTGSEK
jgi:HK97 family phage portal protein